MFSAILSNLFWEITLFLETYSAAVTAFATIFIAIFTVVLALVTGHQAKLTKTLADAAKRQADAAVAIELPIVTINRMPRLERGGHPMEPESGVYITNLVVHNRGRTPAILNEVEVGHCVASNERENADFASQTLVLHNIICDPGAETEIHVRNVLISETQQTIAACLNGQKIFRINIRVRYTDFMRDEHVISFEGFLATFENQNFFVPYGSPLGRNFALNKNR